MWAARCATSCSRLGPCTDSKLPVKWKGEACMQQQPFASWRRALRETRVWGTSCSGSAVHFDKGPRWHKTYVSPVQPTPPTPVLFSFKTLWLLVARSLRRRIMKGLFGCWRFFRLAWWNRENRAVGTFRIPPSPRSPGHGWAWRTQGSAAARRRAGRPGKLWVEFVEWSGVEYGLSRIVCSSPVEFWLMGGGGRVGYPDQVLRGVEGDTICYSGSRFLRIVATAL